MRKQKPITLKRLLNSNQEQLGKVFHHAQELQNLQTIVKQSLDAELAPHCQLLSLHQGELTLEVDSPIWQWRLNMQRMAILQKLRQQGLAQVLTIESKVSPKVIITSASGEQRVSSGYQVDRKMSHKTADELRELAKRMPEPLRSKLLTLADRERD